MTTTDKLTDRDWLISLLTIEQEQMLTDYEVHPDAWKGDPERTDCTAALADGILEGLAHRRASQAAPAHEDDLAVDRFAAVMKAKLAKKRDDGRGGWSGPECSEETLSHMLRDHVVKGDPVDVANFAMMLHQRGERIAQAAPALSDGLREAVEAERERIAVALEAEADLLPCAEDAAVTRSNAALIRADFSYEDADRAALSASPAQEGDSPAMTDPTPTRSEVEHHPRPDVTDLTVQEWAAYRCDDAGAVARKLLAEIQALRDRAEAAERAEAAAWNDAIEAAEAAYAQGFAAIRALRRAAPTEGEA